MSMIAATGIPKFEAGPQKSKTRTELEETRHAVLAQGCQLTGGAEVVEDRVGPYFGIERLDDRRHCTRERANERPDRSS